MIKKTSHQKINQELKDPDQSDDRLCLSEERLETSRGFFERPLSLSHVYFSED